MIQAERQPERDLAHRLRSGSTAPRPQRRRPALGRRQESLRPPGARLQVPDLTPYFGMIPLGVGPPWCGLPIGNRLILTNSLPGAWVAWATTRIEARSVNVRFRNCGDAGSHALANRHRTVANW